MLTISLSLVMVAAGLMVSTPANAALPPISVTAAIRAYAPFVWLYPGDQYQPMSARQFVNESELRWSHAAVRPGIPCNDHRRAARGAITVSRLGQLAPEGYSHRQRGLCAGSRHTHVGRRYYSGELTRPRDQKNPLAPQPEGFFLDLDNASRFGSGSFAPVYYEYRDDGGVKSIEYWFHYGFNRAPWLPNVPRTGLFDHEGDWERIAVLLGSDNRARMVAYYAHEGSCTLPWSAVPKFRGHHPVVFSAKGSHASYPYAGSFRTVFPFIRDDTARGREQWRTWGLLLRASDQDWRGFGGAWGEVGVWRFSTGPLGPGHKELPSFTGAPCQRPRSSGSATLDGDQLDVGNPSEVLPPETDPATVAALNAEADALASYLAARAVPHTVTTDSSGVRTVAWDESNTAANAAVDSFYETLPLDANSIASLNTDPDALAGYLAARGIPYTVTSTSSGVRTVAWDRSSAAATAAVDEFNATRDPMNPALVAELNAESDGRAGHLAARGIPYTVNSDPWGLRTVRWDPADAGAIAAVDAYDAARHPIDGATLAALNDEADALAQTLSSQAIPHTVSTDAWGVRKVTWDETNTAAANAVDTFTAARHPLPSADAEAFNAEADALAQRLRLQMIPHGLSVDPWGVRNVTWDETNADAVAAVDAFYAQRVMRQ